MTTVVRLKTSDSRLENDVEKRIKNIKMKFTAGEKRVIYYLVYKQWTYEQYYKEISIFDSKIMDFLISKNIITCNGLCNQKHEFYPKDIYWLSYCKFKLVEPK